MKPEKVFKRYDIRGLHPEEIDEEFAYRMGRSLASFVKREDRFNNLIVVGKDTKDSSNVLKRRLIDGVVSAGVDVCDVGTGPTDYVAYSGMQEGAVSVQVTSSHMPLEFNGFKFMYPEGNGFLNEDLDRVKNIFRENEFETGSGRVEKASKLENYIEDITDFTQGFDLDWEDKRVVVDCLGGSVLEVVPRVLRYLGCDVICLDEEHLDGTSVQPYRDPPNPGRDQLGELADVVEDRDADLGLGFDLDGDRVALYHKEGFVSGDEVFALLASLVGGDVVGSIDTSERVINVVDSRNNSFYSTRVGDPFVMDKAVEEGAELAGEPNGHFSLLDFVPYNSGSLAGVVLAGLDLETTRSSVGNREVLRESLKISDKEAYMSKVENFIGSRDLELISTLDGFKFVYKGVNVLVRPSGSSSKVRFVLDGNGETSVSEVFSELSRKI